MRGSDERAFGQPVHLTIELPGCASCAIYLQLCKRGARTSTLTKDLRQVLQVGVACCTPNPVNASLQGCSSIVIGLPDCGKVCKEKHLPGFIERYSEVRHAGFENVIIASVTTPEKLERFMDETGARKAGMRALADTNGAFTRMLGLDINAPGSQPPYSQRYIIFVEDGILVRTARPRTHLRCTPAVGAYRVMSVTRVPGFAAWRCRLSLRRCPQSSSARARCGRLPVGAAPRQRRRVRGLSLLTGTPRKWPLQAQMIACVQCVEKDPGNVDKANVDTALKIIATLFK
jgi:peroxiredoxin